MIEKVEDRFSKFIMKFTNSFQLFIAVSNRSVDRLFNKLEGSSSVVRRSSFERFKQAIQTVCKSDWVIGIDVMILRV